MSSEGGSSAHQIQLRVPGGGCYRQVHARGRGKREPVMLGVSERAARGVARVYPRSVRGSRRGRQRAERRRVRRAGGEGVVAERQREVPNGVRRSPRGGFHSVRPGVQNLQDARIRPRAAVVVRGYRGAARVRRVGSAPQKQVRVRVRGLQVYVHRRRRRQRERVEIGLFQRPSNGVAGARPRSGFGMVRAQRSEVRGGARRRNFYRKGEIAGRARSAVYECLQRISPGAEDARGVQVSFAKPAG